MNRKRGRLIIMSGPSGTGKSTLQKKLLERDPNIMFSVSVTTRAPRPGERDGVNYYFVSREDYDRMVYQGELLEHAEYVGNGYGTPVAQIDAALAQGRDVLLDIEVQGAQQVMQKRPDALKIFILPPSVEEMEKRLRGRGTNDEDSIHLRVDRAMEELKMQNIYDYRVVNDDVDRAVSEIEQILKSEKGREAL